MADITKIVSRIIHGNITGRVSQVIYEIDGLSACAGIKGSEGGTEKGKGGINIALEAKVNHYERTVRIGRNTNVFIPARPYITDTEEGELEQESLDILKDYIRKAIKSSPSIRKQQWKEYREGASKYHTSAYDSKGRSLGNVMAFGESNSPRYIMRDLAKEMLGNQLRAMENVAPNTESTLDRKSRRSEDPLVDYGDLKKATKRWIETPNGEVELVGGE